MIKNNKWKIIISSIATLMPIPAGILLWNILPDNMSIHWNASGEIDSTGTKALAVFLPPILMLAMHFICILVTAADRKNKDQNKKVFGIVFMIAPFLSIYVSSAIYASAFGYGFNMSKLTFMLIGLMFIIIGNYLPKCKQNHTIGIKLPWTVGNEENWNKTHRLGGILWVICGVIILIAVLFPIEITVLVLIAVIAIAAVIPTAYSYVIYKRSGSPKPTIGKNHKIATILSLIIVLIMLIALIFVCFTGNVVIEFGDNAFTINAAYWSDITVEYTDIESIEYRESDNVGSRTSGFGSPRLLLGSFENEELGRYTRYTYTVCRSCVLLKINGNILIVNGSDAEATKSIYESITARIDRLSN